MPNPANYDNREEWMAACIPIAMEEGRERDQAVAMCSSMWENRSETIIEIDDELSQEMEELKRI